MHRTTELTSRVLRAVKIFFIASVFLLPVNKLFAFPADCDADPSTFSGVLEYDLDDGNINASNSYCELCGIGTITILVANTRHEDMADFSVTHDFLDTDLEYVPGSTVGGGDPTISGTQLTWTSAEIAELALIDGVGGNHNNPDTVTIEFQVRSIPGTEETLVIVPRDIEATADYIFCPGDKDEQPGTASDQEILPIREPIPVLEKSGRNVDADQDVYATGIVYGNINDDVIWRLRIQNDGLAAMQDLTFDDLMTPGNFQINYACPNAGEADTVANTANNGVAPGGSSCVAATNIIDDFIVDDPFGTPDNDEPGAFIDVPAGGSTDIYLVGKITSSCNANTTNTLSDIQWGCEVIPPDGGITQTSAGNTPAPSSITLSSLVDSNNLNITRELTGLDTGQPVGSRGLMTITITNLSGGSVKDIHLANVLPPEYVVDPTFDPATPQALVVTTPFGDYEGVVDTLVWTNPAAAADPLSNTAPEFDLLSTTANANYPDQENMLRHGDVAVVQFRVVMIQPAFYDNNANIDIREENTGDTTDPDNSRTLDNQLTVTYEDFCDTAVVKTLPVFNDTFPSDPEDLDIDISGLDLEFILTNDPDQALPLQVDVINNGGHYAEDYHVFVSFGATMEVSRAPGNCSPSANPPFLEVWDDPADIPSSATVYECSSREFGGDTGLDQIEPGQTVSLNFEVIKTTDETNLMLDDLTFRADVVGEITLSDGTPLVFPTPDTSVIANRANNYSLDSIRARVLGFNLIKIPLGTCSENNPPPASPDDQVQIGEECSVHIESGGWFGFDTPGFTFIAVQNIQVDDELPGGQGYISSTNPVLTSDPTILSINLIPPPAVLDEGTFGWTFNQALAERIIIRDQWFRVDATTRLLNDPIDTRAPPNEHAELSRNILNSSFEAVFADGGIEEVFPLGPATVGYPNEPIRRVDLNITEPDILVEKEVCNETLNGVGTACSRFRDQVDDGDTQDSYIYRITLSNRNRTGGFVHAPAYDITSTDVLDASDLMLVEPFESDGLDNDGDGLIDGADLDGEGTISDNIIDNATPATITFSHTHSTALLRLDANSDVVFYYRVDPDDAIAPLQELTNTVNVTYDSMEGASGNQTLQPGANSEIGGARVYDTIPATATVQILPLQTRPKEIIALSNSPLGGARPDVSVGEEIEYQLTAFLPVANLREFTISDELPDGIRCIEAPVVNLDAAPYDVAGFMPGGSFTPTCTDSLVLWEFGDQELTAALDDDLFEFIVSFIARVDNTAGENDGDRIRNGNPRTDVFVSYINEVGRLITEDFDDVEARIREPEIVLSKDFETASNDAADVITVTVTAENTGSASAYNLRVFDDLAAVSNLSFLNNVAGLDPPDNVDTTTFGANSPVFSWNAANPDFAIAPGETRSFTFDISVDITAQALEILDNTIEASWTSLPSQSTALNSTGLIGVDGSVTGMRNGTIPNSGDAVNDYETTATTFTTVPALSLIKSDLSTGLAPEIGAHKNFEIEIILPEGTTTNLSVSDALDNAGISYLLADNADFDITYSFSGIASINGVSPASESVFLAVPVDNTSGNAVWDIGTVITESEDDTTGTPNITPTITINYFARINNDLVTDSGDDLQNAATISYTHGETGSPETLTVTTTEITVTESVLEVNKVATPISPAPIAGGDIVEYIISIPNTGDATAYDVNIVDTLPVGLELDSSFTPTVLIDGSAVAGFIATPGGAPLGPLVWGRDNGDDSLDIPAGDALTLTYRVVVQSTASAGVDLINSVWVDWTSLDGVNVYERTGDGCPVTIDPDDYCVGPATAIIATLADPPDALLKENPADTSVAVGEIFTYQITVPATPYGFDMNDVRILDDLGASAADLSFISVSKISGSQPWTPVNTGTLTNLVIEDTTIGIDIPAGEQVVVAIEVQVLDTATNVGGLLFNNTATYTYNQLPNDPASQLPGFPDTTPDMIIVGPDELTLEKSGPAEMRPTVPETFTLNVHNIGTSPAWDITITDLLPTLDPAAGGTCEAAPTNVTAQIFLADGVTPVSAVLLEGVDYVVTFTGEPSCVFTITTQSAAAALPEDNRLIITYQTVLDADTPGNTSLTNIAGATEWFNADTDGTGASGETRTFVEVITDGTVGTLDHEDAHTVLSRIPTLVVQKTVVNATSGQDPGSDAQPGDVLRYRILIQNISDVAVPDFSFVDDLGALNPIPLFEAGTLTLVTVPVGADSSFTNPNGGINGTGLVDIRNLSLGIAGSANDSVLIEFDVQLIIPIVNGTVVFNQGSMQIFGIDFLTDDPNINGADDPLIAGDEDPTETLINSLPPDALLKENPADTSVAVGEIFTYQITVPATPYAFDLNDVRILDDLSASAADLSFISVSKISGSQPWTPENTGTLTNLVIEDTTIGIDIPAGEQVVVGITVQVLDTATNVSGLLFNNTASYTYNQLPNDPATELPGLPDTTPDMTIVGPDELTLEKSGPAEMRPTVPETFTLNVHNIGTSPAWDITVTDLLPNLAPAAGGTCEAAPTNVTAQIFLADGVTSVSAVLTQGVDYVVTFSGEPSCVFTITMQSAAAALPEDNRLIITYQTVLDADTPGDSSLTNIAGATEWFSADTDGAGATGETRTFVEVITDGTVGTLDHEDALTVLSRVPSLVVQKSVVNVSSGQDPGSNAQPGDVLRYSVLIQNISDVAVPDFSFTDDLDALNTIPMFEAGTLTLITVPVGADSSNTDPNGGINGTGLVDIRNLTLGIAGSATESVLIEFEVQLIPSIVNGTVVFNQGNALVFATDFLTDDPNINGADDPLIVGDEDPTETLIASAPLFEVLKTSTDLTDDPNILLSGDTLRYTITLQNIGTEDASNATLRDQLPANTSYVAGSTTLNGVVVSEPTPGVLPLQDGILINAPEDTTPGFMRADASGTTTNIATISFDVIINDNVVNGTVISNQGFVTGDGSGGAIPEQPSDDPDTSTPNDPTIDVVGNQPLVDALKTVEIVVDNGTPDILDPGDTIRYTITISNLGATPATGVTFTDAVPTNTTYVADSVTLNGLPVAQPDAGVSPLISGIDVSSSDLTPPLPTAGNGIVSPGEEAVITFDVQVDLGVATGTIISNQGSVDNNELPTELTDADGIDSNGDQPTLIVVGDAQLLTITKDVAVVGGGAALAGGQLEYRVRVTNIGSVPASNVVIIDNLDIPVAGQLTYVAGSGLLNGLADGVSFADPILTGDYSSIYGDLQPNESAELRFLAVIDSSLAIGTTITNVADVNWNSPTETATAEVSIDVGGTPGVANVSGTLWHDANFDNVLDATELPLEGWTVEILRNGTSLGTVTSDAAGVYQINGLLPNDVGTDFYELRFTAPGATNTTALLGLADSVFNNGLQRIDSIVLGSGSNTLDLNLPIDPNGVVYDSILRIPVAGTTLTLLNAGSGAALPSSCFDDPAQQDQVTLAEGYYKFDLNFSQASCASGSDYLIQITLPALGYTNAPSVVIPPETDATTAPFDIPGCPGSIADALAVPADYCEAQGSEFAPSLAIPPATVGTNYYLNLTLASTLIPQDSQLFNNHLPIDPELSDAVTITKTTPLVNVTRSQLVPYTITINNTLPITLPGVNIVDSFPPGFKYVAGSARFNDGVTEIPLEPISDANTLQLIWSGIDLPTDQAVSIKLLLIVGAAVTEGEYINRAQIIETLTDSDASGIATATVRVIPDPDFDCSDIIGKVFDDKNRDGIQDEGETGLAGVRLTTARGLVASTDQHGRFHVTCAVVPDPARGSNFVMKLDERSLPTGYRVTSENPRVQRATRGKMLKFNFGASIHRVVSMDIADGIFQPDSVEMLPQWRPRLDLLITQLQEGPSVLRLSYLADVEKKSLAEARLKKVKQEVIKKWQAVNTYELGIESDIFWRRGAPPKRGVID